MYAWSAEIQTPNEILKSPLPHNAPRTFVKRIVLGCFLFRLASAIARIYSHDPRSKTGSTGLVSTPVDGQRVFTLYYQIYSPKKNISRTPTIIEINWIKDFLALWVL